MPALPHHHEGQKLPIDEAIALVERVRASAEKHAHAALNALAAAVPGITAIALRERQPLPATIPERLTNYNARNVADWVMYREALARAAQSRGWSVTWFDPKRLNVTDGALDLRKKLGAPWTSDHKLAMAAARAVSHSG